MQLECVSSSWTIKALILLPFPPPPRPEFNQVPLGHHVLLRPLLPRHTTDWPGADWCPNPGLGGDPPGDHLSSYQQRAQILQGVHSGTRSPHYYTLLQYYTLLSNSLSCLNEIWSSLWSNFSDWFFSTILNPSLNVLMIQVSTDVLTLSVFHELHDVFQKRLSAGIFHSSRSGIWDLSATFVFLFYFIFFLRAV